MYGVRTAPYQDGSSVLSDRLVPVPIHPWRAGRHSVGWFPVLYGAHQKAGSPRSLALRGLGSATRNIRHPHQWEPGAKLRHISLITSRCWSVGVTVASAVDCREALTAVQLQPMAAPLN